MQFRDMLIRITLIAFLSISAPAYAADWVYERAIDPMTDETAYSATLKSMNAINIKYGKPGHLFITVTSHPRNGWGVEFAVENNQISCTLDCFTTIRFDSEKAARNVMEQVFNVKDTVYKLRNNAEKVAAGLFDAQKVMVELPIFEQGAQLFRFEANAIDTEAFPNQPINKDQLISAEREWFSKLYLERIKNNWEKPEDMASNAYAMVSFQIDRVGDVDAVIVLPARVGSPSQNMMFKKSVEEALMKSVPLPVSEDDEVRSALYRFSLKFPG